MGTYPLGVENPIVLALMVVVALADALYVHVYVFLKNKLDNDNSSRHAFLIASDFIYT